MVKGGNFTFFNADWGAEIIGGSLEVGELLKSRGWWAPTVGMSTLNKWITAHRDTAVVSRDDLELAQENNRLRLENRILKEEREILKKATVFFTSQKP